MCDAPNLLAQLYIYCNKEIDLMQDTKQCPFCREEIKAVATVCRYCHSQLKDLAKDRQGKRVKIRLKTGEKVYFGDIFLPCHIHRASDVINDERHYIILSNAFEETRIRDVPVGFVAINKRLTEWVELKDHTDFEETEKGDEASRELH